MSIDGEKLRNIRLAKGISQEKLAIMCNVNKRTIQRAEKGAPIALETAAFIAEAIQVSPATLRASQGELFEAKGKAWNDVILVPNISGRRIIETIRTSFEAVISFDVEPTEENLAPLAEAAEILERFKPDPWEIPAGRYNPGYPETLEMQARLNAVMLKLSALGVTVFTATYLSRRQIPRYDHEEGQMYVTVRTPNTAVDIALIVLSDSSASHLIRSPFDMEQDDIPF